MISPITYLKHVREEFTHIVWPNNRVALAHTLVVIGIAVIIAIFVSILDHLFGTGVNTLVG